MRKRIWGQTIVKNEDRYLWFSIVSVIDYLDKILIWDTDSTDNTIKIINELKKRYPEKIVFEKIGPVDEKKFTQMRQAMLDKTKSDWIFILDGDEVWWENSIKKVVKTIHTDGDKLDLIVTPFYSVVGDIYHYQEKAAGKYNLLGKKGHLNIRAINRMIPGLYVDQPYGSEGFFDENGNKIQDRARKKLFFLETPYLHFSNISRSSHPKADKLVMQRDKKIRYEIGLKFPDNFLYPEVFYKDIPEIVSSPWVKMKTSFRIKAMIQTPIRKIKRRLQ